MNLHLPRGTVRLRLALLYGALFLVSGAVLLGVKLKAKIERMDNGVDLRLIIAPATEKDERTIAKHCEKMTRVGIPAVANLVEPPRPGMPAFPNIIGAPPPPADGGV